MLNTFIKLGEQLSDGRGEWDDIIDKPNLSKEREKDFNLYVAEIIMDMDKNDIYINPELKIYDENSSFLYKNLDTELWGRNGAPWAVCVEAEKLEVLQKSIFGKVGKSGEISGSLLTTISSKVKEPSIENSEFVRVLKEFQKLQDQSYKILKDNFVKNNIDVGKKGKIVLCYISLIKSEWGYISPKRISDLKGYTDVIDKLLAKKFNKVSNNSLCYATGKESQELVLPEFIRRRNINKIFITETKNYAINFDGNNFSKNYKIDTNSRKFLESGANYILNSSRIRIAGIDHCIIPQFLNQTDINIKRLLKDVFKKSELLFQSDAFESLTQKIGYKLDEEELYWITFLAFESDGNYFKTISEIKDVSKLHFNKVIETFAKVGNWFKNDLSYAVDWQRVMLNYGKVLDFNLNTVYSLIPQRKDKEKKNEALVLFKSILEQRPIPAEKVFTHFCSLVLCHYYRRYEAFKNIKPYDEKGFDFAIRDAVYKYLAFLTVLKQLNLLYNMEETTEKELELIPLEEVTSDFGKRINTFFTQMSYSPAQKAMFYLGRMLSTVAYIQKDKKKNVLEKVNFNGMDKEDIQRLRNSLIEKAKQYGEVNKVIFNDARFTEFFDYNNWKISGLKPEEAVFFILSGYSFGLNSKS